MAARPWRTIPLTKLWHEDQDTDPALDRVAVRPSAMIGQILSHPFTLLLVGALLTGVLAPRLLRGWQDGAKSLELKAAMVEEIAKSTETFFSRIELIELKGEAAVTSLDEALTDWRTSYA